MLYFTRRPLWEQDVCWFGWFKMNWIKHRSLSRDCIENWMNIRKQSHKLTQFFFFLQGGRNPPHWHGLLLWSPLPPGLNQWPQLQQAGTDWRLSANRWLGCNGSLNFDSICRPDFSIVKDDVLFCYVNKKRGDMEWLKENRVENFTSYLNPFHSRLESDDKALGSNKILSFFPPSTLSQASLFCQHEEKKSFEKLSFVAYYREWVTLWVRSRLESVCTYVSFVWKNKAVWEVDCQSDLLILVDMSLWTSLSQVSDLNSLQALIL